MKLTMTFCRTPLLARTALLLLAGSLAHTARATPADATPPPAAAAPRTNAAIVPVPREQDGPQKRYELLNQRVKDAAGDVHLVFLGDSITQGWEGAGKNVWKRYYGDRKALNLGIGGDRTQHILWRLDNGNFAGLKPKAIVLMIGTNNSNREDHTAGEILEGVTAIVRKLQTMSPASKILLLGIFPRGQSFNDQRGKILQVNQALAKLDDGQRVFFLDFGSQLIEADGSISKAVMPDYLHLSEGGYQTWAAAIEPRLAKLLGTQPIAAETSPAAGEWIWQMKGPNEEEVRGPLVLEVADGRVTGEFRTEAGRTLKIRSGTLTGNQLKIVVVRDRPQGGEITYNMTGTITGNSLEGEATAEFNGQEVRVPWSARRK